MFVNLIDQRQVSETFLPSNLVDSIGGNSRKSEILPPPSVSPTALKTVLKETRNSLDFLTQEILGHPQDQANACIRGLFCGGVPKPVSSFSTRILKGGINPSAKSPENERGS